MCRRTPPGVRELKRKAYSEEHVDIGGRTPPGVRELKLIAESHRRVNICCRTPPGVRELKRDPRDSPYRSDVAPLPGCVN